MQFSLKKGMPALILTLILSIVMVIGSASAATTKNFTIVKATDPTQTSAADGYAVKPASIADDGETVTIGFNTSILYSINGFSVSYDGGTSYTPITGTVSGSVIYYTFPVDDFGPNTKATITVNVFGLYNMTHDIQIDWL